MECRVLVASLVIPKVGTAQAQLATVQECSRMVHKHPFGAPPRPFLMAAIQSATEQCIELAMAHPPAIAQSLRRLPLTRDRRRWGDPVWVSSRSGPLEESDDDDITCCVFKRSPRTPISRSRTHVHVGAIGAPLTPAQQYAARYRASASAREGRRTAGPTSHVRLAERTTADVPPRLVFGGPSVSESMGPKVRFRRSRNDAMDIYVRQPLEWLYNLIDRVVCRGHRHI